MENTDKPVATPSRAAQLLKRVAGSTEAVPVQPKPTEPKQEMTPPASVPSEPVVEDYDINPKKEVKPVEVETPKDTIPKEYLPDDPTDEIDQLMDPKGTTGENFKKLRTKLKAVNSEKNQFKTELENLRQKVADYETGLAVPEITAEQTRRIEELEIYEKLYNFKASPVYKKNFVEPITQEQTKLAELANEYGVGVEVLNAAFAATTTAETNRILSQHFTDDVGALEAKSIIKNIKKIQSDALEAEKEPAQSLARMQQENDRILAEQRAKANDSIVHTSKEGWSESLLTLREDTRFPEIVYREGDSEHNDKYVRPILTRAGQEYGKFVRVLAEHGLTELPKEVSIALARMTKLAHLSAVKAVENEHLRNRVAELESKLTTKHSVNRPGVNGTGGGNNVYSSPSGKAVGPAAAGRNALNRVLSK